MGCLSSTTAKDSEDQKITISNSNNLRKIIFLGLEGGGKTSIIQYLKTGQFQNVNQTIGTKVETINSSYGNFIVFDMGGGFSLKEQWNHYFDNLDGLVFVIDSTQQNQIQLLKEEIHQLVLKFQQKGIILIYFNKIDCQNCIDINWLLKETNLQTTQSDVILQRCSAKTGQGILEGIEKMNKLFDTNKKLM